MKVTTVNTEERPATTEDIRQGALEVLASAFGVATPDYARMEGKHNPEVISAAVRIVELTE